MTTETASSATPGALAASVEAVTNRLRSQAGGRAVPAAPPATDYDERAVRLALAAGAANLRLALVRDALKDCCEADRTRILRALGDES